MESKRGRRGVFISSTLVATLHKSLYVLSYAWPVVVLFNRIEEDVAGWVTTTIMGMKKFFYPESEQRCWDSKTMSFVPKKSFDETIVFNHRQCVQFLFWDFFDHLIKFQVVRQEL